jgi:hypothetical protein
VVFGYCPSEAAARDGSPYRYAVLVQTLSFRFGVPTIDT